MNLPQLCAESSRVRVRTATPADVPAFERAITQSAQRVGEWNPVHRDDLAHALQRQSDVYRTFLIHAKQPHGDHDLVGKVNLFNVVRGRFWSGTLGYDSFDPYAGTGLFAEGMRLVMDLCTARPPSGMGLHRLEANVQPPNTRSAGLLRSLGFRHERRIPRMLFLHGGGAPESWRDHDSYALTVEDRRERYAPNLYPCTVVVVHGTGPVVTDFSRALAAELGLPLLSKDALLDVVADEGAAEAVIDAQLAASVIGAVVQTDRAVLGADRALHVRMDDDAAHAPDEILLDPSMPVPARDVVRTALAARARS